MHHRVRIFSEKASFDAGRIYTDVFDGIESRMVNHLSIPAIKFPPMTGMISPSAVPVKYGHQNPAGMLISAMLPVAL
jgi:hypothetical protein